MNDQAFARLVAEDVKNRAPQERRNFLRLPENWERWQDFLLALIDNLEGQERSLAIAEKTDIERYEALGDDGLNLLNEVLADYSGRRKKINRFKFHVEARLDEVTRMIALGSESVDERTKLISFLRRCIEQHRKMMSDFDVEPSPIDSALWAALDGKWAFDDIDEQALSELL